MSESDPTASELLTAVNAAMLAILSGKKQSYRIGEIEYTYANLNDLRELRKELLQSARTSSVMLGDLS